MGNYVNMRRRLLAGKVYRTKDTMGQPQIIAGHLANECVTKHRAQRTLLGWKRGVLTGGTGHRRHSRTRTMDNGQWTVGAAGVAARSKVSRANVVLIANCDWNAVEMENTNRKQKTGQRSC